MADSKISALTEQTSLEDANEFVLADSGATKKITGANLKYAFSAFSGPCPPTNFTYENATRYSNGATGSAGTSGTLRMAAIWLPAGFSVTKIGVVCGSTGEAGGTHAWCALYNSSRELLRQSTNETGATFVAASSVATFTLSSFTTTYTGLHYVGNCVVASTMPNLIGLPSLSSALAGAAPILGGNTSDTGLTTTAPATAGTITVSSNVMYVCVG